MQRAFSGFDQGLQRRCQLRRAGKKPIDHHFIGVTGQDATQLPSAPIALHGKIAFRREGRFGSARHTADIHIQHLPGAFVVVPIALTMQLIDAVHRLLHLLHILRCTGIQRLLHHRLFRATASPERYLQRLIAAQPIIDFSQPMRTGQQANEPIVEFVSRAMFDGLLGNRTP